MKKMIRFYRDRKITTKLLIIFCMFLLVPSICTFLWTYERSIQDIAQFISGSALQHYNQTYDYLLNKLDSVKEEADTLAGNPEFKRIVSQNREEYSDYQQVDDMYSLDDILNSYQNRLNVTKTVIYISDGLIYSDRMRIRPFESVENADWYQDFSARRSSTAFYASGDLWGKGAFLVRKIPHPMHYNQVVCMIRMEISNMAEILSNADISEACLTYIVDESGELVGVSNPEVAQTLELDMLEELPSSEKFTEMDVGGRRMFCIARDLPGTAWTMVSLLPYQVLDEISRSQVTTSFVVLLVMIVFIMLAIILISHTLLRKIEAVMDRMRSVENGEFKPMPACMEGHDEAGALTQTYNEMVYTIRRLMIQQEQTHQQLRAAEGQALQAQIKPHFLYNTLEMIGWLNRVGRDEDVQFAIESLARFYKETLKSGKEAATLAEEVAHVKTYIDIQSLRFENIRLHLSLEEETNSVSMPKITLQPVIENALYHGILEKDEDEGNIWIVSRRSGEDVLITIEDDGVGMSQQQMQDILVREPQKKGYGIWNVHQRLRLFFGKEYGLRYTARPGGGVRVQLLIPAKSISQAAKH